MDKPGHQNQDLPLVGSLRGLVVLVFTLACLTVAIIWRNHEAAPADEPAPSNNTPTRWNLKVKPLPEQPAPPPIPEAPPEPAMHVPPAGKFPVPPAPAAALPAPSDSNPQLVPASEIPAGRSANLFDSPGPQIVASTWGIVGHISLKGTPPLEKAILMDPACGKLHSAKPTTQFYVVGTNQGLADVFVQIKGLSNSSLEPPTQPVLLDQAGCEYFPYVLTAQTGQKIVVKNSDPFMHNVHPTPTVIGNQEENKAQPPGSPNLTFSFTTAELFLRFKCDVHPWMFAYVCVADHPYFGLSNRDGNYHLPKLPPGYYVIEVTHRKAGTQTRTIRILPDRVATENFVLEVK